jgi:hypothetical protein
VHSPRETPAIAAERERLQREEAEHRATAAEQERLRKEAEDRAAVEAAEQERLRQEAIAVEQARVQKEAEDRAAAEAAEQERLRQEAIAVEQARLQRQAEDSAAAEAAEQERLKQEAIVAEQVRLQREEKERAAAVALEQERAQQEATEKAAAEEAANAAEQERLQQEAEAAERFRLEREAEERIAEEERTLQERAIALAHLQQGDNNVFASPDAGPFERSSSTTQIDLPMDVPSMIIQLREGSDSPDQDQGFPEAAIESHTIEAPTGEASPPRTVTAALEPITEEAEVSNPHPSESDRQRQLRERIAERRRADKEKVANSERAPLEIDDNFTQTRGAEIEDLYTNEPDEVAIPPELLTEPTLPSDGASDILRQDRIQAADTAASAATMEPLPQVTVTRTQSKSKSKSKPKSKSKSKPKGIQKARQSAQATKSPAASRASFDPSTRPLTQMEFHGIMADLPAWPGSDQSAHDDVRANMPLLSEPSSASALTRLWGRRRRRPQDPATEASPRRQQKTPDPRQVPPPPSDLTADTIIFRVWRGGRWIEIERVPLDPHDPFHVERVANRYEQVERAEFYDKSMHKIAVPQCLQVAQDEGTYSVLMMFPDGLFGRTITRAMVTAADNLSDVSEPGQGRKRAR